MKKRKQTMVKNLCIAFVIILIIVGLIAFGSFNLLTKEINTEIENSDINTIEGQMESIFGIIGTRMIYLLVCAFIVGIVIIGVTGKKIIAPIKKLSNATNEITKGNYNIEIVKDKDDEIGELTDNFNKMAKALNGLEYMQKDFISNVSHEFKTPISVIQGYIKLLEDEDLKEKEQKEYLHIIKEETDKLAILATNSLRLSKIESQQIQIRKEKIRLDEQIRKCILSLEKLWNKKKIEFNIELEEIELIAEKNLVSQVWTNLIENAIKFSNENGKITIIAKRENNNAIVRIKDEGIGIAKEQQDKIFDKFYQIDQSHTKEGNGLGLSIVNRIIKLCNGEIKIESEIGKGTEFIVILPIKNEI